MPQEIGSCICNDEGGRMKLALFRTLCLSAALLCILVIIPCNFLYHLPPIINLFVGIFSVAAIHLYRASRAGRYLPKTLFFLILVLLNLVWFANGGSTGSVSYYFFCLIVYVPIFFRGRVRWFLAAAAIADCVLLLFAELALPHLLVPFVNEHARVADLVVGMCVTAVCCSTMLWSLLKSYDQEQKRLIALNEHLQRNLQERVEVERCLLHSRELLNAVVEGSTDAIFVKDIGGNYILFNHAAGVMTGKGAAEVMGRDDTFLFPPEVAQRIRLMDREIFETNRSALFENELVTAEGRTIVCEVMKGPLHDSQGRTVGLFGVSRDVTESRRMAEELRKLNEELELRVMQRTAMLEAAMREQESFSYSVSHDLRGPLRHINCYAAIVEEEFGPMLPDEAKAYLARVRTSSSRMGSLIDDLLELSRIGRSELHKAPVSLSGLAWSILGGLKEAEPERRVELVVEPGLEAHGDLVLLGQMLANLIGNAWKYSATRDCARIEFGREVAEGKEVFFVRDNGVGFDMAYQDKLFGPFQRLHGSQFEGTGIGLATVKRIVERHHGRVWAHGEVDQGTTVYFCLP